MVKGVKVVQTKLLLVTIIIINIGSSNLLR